MSESVDRLLPLDRYLDGIRQGDEESARAFVQRYEPMLLRVLRVTGKIRWLQGQVETQDLVQSVFMAALEEIRKGAASFSDEDKLEAFLKTIGRRRLAEIIRHARAKRRDRHRTIQGEAAGLDRESTREPSPSAIVSIREQVSRVERCADPADLDVLREKQEGASWEDLAARRGTTPEALRKKIERVRQRVRDSLARADGESPSSEPS